MRACVCACVYERTSRSAGATSARLRIGENIRSGAKEMWRNKARFVAPMTEERRDNAATSSIILALRRERSRRRRCVQRDCQFYRDLHRFRSLDSNRLLMSSKERIPHVHSDSTIRCRGFTLLLLSHRYDRDDFRGDRGSIGATLIR